jgi:predicted peroxiredoxin
MSAYLLIESRDPFDSNDVSQIYDLATGLRRDNHDVTLFLVQNGVLPARRSTRSQALSDLAAAGVEILADEFSLRERGIADGSLAAGVSAASIDVVIDQLAEGRKAIWH